MNKKVKQLILFSSISSAIIIVSSLLICSYIKYLNDNKRYENLKYQFNDWYNNLTIADWNKDDENNFINYHSNSEQQSIGLYSWCSGSFWNEPLHRGYEPVNVKLKLINNNLDSKNAYEIRGSDYKYIESALLKANYPIDDILWHGVEYMETEFYEQLEKYIIKTNYGYDYSGVVGQVITSNGFLSSSLSKKVATDFFGWRPNYEWPTDLIENNPLKEPVVFKINIKRGYNGAAFLSNFDFAGFGNGSKEQQVLINRGAKLKINSVWSEKNFSGQKFTIFDVDLL
ncbi:MAG: ADP-ribosyltransferase [Metamycoplasmataceae bacterium]